MTTFIKFMFYFLSFGFVIKLLCIGLLPYPRKANDRWMDMVDLFIYAPIIVWAWHLVYGA